MRPLPHLILIASLTGFAATTCSAAVITSVGDNATNAARWRTATAAKAFNPANNNIYGNDGYVMFATEPANTSAGAQAAGVNPFTFSGTLNGVTATTLTAVPTYVSSFAQASGFTNVSNTSGNANFDSPAGASLALRSGVGYMSEPITGDNNAPIFTFTVNSRVPKFFTVGLFFTTSGGITSGAGITGGGGSATTTKSVSNNGALEALFFRITGAASGDTYTVGVSGPGGSLLGNNIDIMGITFDSTPEPCTLAGCAAASLAMIWLSRRRKKVLVPGSGYVVPQFVPQAKKEEFKKFKDFKGRSQEPEFRSQELMRDRTRSVHLTICSRWVSLNPISTVLERDPILSRFQRFLLFFGQT